MSAARTPGPWYVRTLPDGSGAFIEAKAPGRPYNQEILADDYWDEFSKAADAAFIVKACNAHDELVAALREIEGYSGHYATQKNPSIRAIQDIARAALAKVQSGGGGV